MSARVRTGTLEPIPCRVLNRGSKEGCVGFSDLFPYIFCQIIERPLIAYLPMSKL